MHRVREKKRSVINSNTWLSELKPEALVFRVDGN